MIWFQSEEDRIESNRNPLKTQKSYNLVVKEPCCLWFNLIPVFLTFMVCSYHLHFLDQLLFLCVVLFDNRRALK